MAKILVVDDHPHIVRLLKRELESEAHEVITAATGEEALHLIRKEQPALMLLDVMLPGMDGFEVLRAVKADPAARLIRVVLLTAKDQPSEMTHGLQLGADWYVTKPFSPGDVATLIRRLLEEFPAGPAALKEGTMMLPIVEIDLLTLTAADAFDLAARGNVKDGYACLSAGLQRAGAAHAAGQPWADELVRRYQEIFDHYLDRYGRKADEPEAALADS